VSISVDPSKREESKVRGQWPENMVTKDFIEGTPEREGGHVGPARRT